MMWQQRRVLFFFFFFFLFYLTVKNTKHISYKLQFCQIIFFFIKTECLFHLPNSSSFNLELRAVVSQIAHGPANAVIAVPGSSDDFLQTCKKSSTIKVSLQNTTGNGTCNLSNAAKSFSILTDSISFSARGIMLGGFL